MDENEFFRQATLRICGDLEIEKAMFSCIQFLRQTMPADRMALQLYEPSLASMRTIAIVAASECNKIDKLTPLSSDARAIMMHISPLEVPDVVLEYSENYTKISQEMLRFHRLEPTSLILLPLTTKGRTLGSLPQDHC